VTTIGKLVVVRFLDKRVLKGRIVDFHPNREFFHVEEPGGAAPTRVEVEGLKAIFFVKTLEGNPQHVERRAFEERTGTEKKVWIEFSDGEKLAGWSNSFGSARGGFYVFPADEDSNMEKAYVFRSAVLRLEEGEAAETAARGFHAGAQASQPPTPGEGVRSASAGVGPDLTLDTRPLDAVGEPEPAAVGTYRLGRGAIRSEGRTRSDR
jgi:hypothetical protein